jgi:hypothetical protein
LNSPQTISSDLGIAESAPEPGRFSMPEERSSPFPKSRKDRHKYIFRTCDGLDSATADCTGSPGQNTRELSGWAPHLRGERGLVKRTNAMLVVESGECTMLYSRVRNPSKAIRTSQRSMLDSCAQLSQSTDSAECTSWKWGDNSGTSSIPSETKDDSSGRTFGCERVATRIEDSGL